MQSVHKIAFDGEPDLVHVRRVVRRLAQLLRFDQRDEIRITAAVSELARAASVARGGAVELGFSVDNASGAGRLVIEVEGPGLARAAFERGSATAEGVVAAEKLLERIGPAPAQQGLRFGEPLPELALLAERLPAIRAELERMDPPRMELSREELQRLNQELATALLEIEERKEELATLNTELRDTNRGVVALYAELDERATELRRADELKTRFFSQMSHEFRTPLNSIRALSNMLLEEADGPLRDEQRRQVGLIRDGVASLLDIVGDLLDIAKMEAGKTTIDVAPFSVAAMFGALRAMVRPLLGTDAVALELDAGADLPPLVSDEGKVAQILRNFLSNAVKFTERGSITVTARLVPAGAQIEGVALAEPHLLFAVADTGIGIAREHQAAIFEEFQQVESRLQRKSRGTGLGLPLCHRFAGLLGGRVWVESEVGQGATFYLLLPLVHDSAAAAPSADSRLRLLIVGERPERRASIAAPLADGVFETVECQSAGVSAESVAALRPAAAIVDAASTSAAALDVLRAAAVPLVAAVGDVAPDRLVGETYRALLRAPLRSILVVDDDEAYQAILARRLAPFCERVRVVGDPRAGLAGVGDADCLVLDLVMPELDGWAVLQRVRATPATARLPVVVCSSKQLSAEERATLRRLRAPFLPKDALVAARIAHALVEAQRATDGSAPESQESAA